jgi:hypothetical protein
MSQRIRYQRTQPGVLVSRRNFMTADGQEVKVELNTNEKKYRILNSVTGDEVVSATGNTRNTSVLKIQAKRGLSDLGVIFTEEKRVRTEADSAVGQ